MPTYEFVCPNGHHFDKFYRKISDATSELPCPECGATAARQISGGAGLLFKGSGFYITDYGKDGKKGMTSPSSTSAHGSASGGSGESASSGGNGGSAGASTSDTKSAKPDTSKKSE